MQIRDPGKSLRNVLLAGGNCEAIQLVTMVGATCTRASLLCIVLSSLIIANEACAPGFTYIPDINHYQRQCVPCKRSDDGRGRGSIWNELYNDHQGLSEEPSPRFGFQVGPIITTAAPCCEATTTTTPAPTQPPITRLQNITGDACILFKLITLVQKI